MSANLDPVDAALESLRQPGSSNRDSYFQKLEDRLMSEQRKPFSWNSRLTKVAAIAAVCVVFGSAASFAAVQAWRFYSGTYSAGEDGTILDEQGNEVGQTTNNGEGGFTTTLEMDGATIEFEHDEELRGTQFQLEWEAQSGNSAPDAAGTPPQK